MEQYRHPTYVKNRTKVFTVDFFCFGTTLFVLCVLCQFQYALDCYLGTKCLTVHIKKGMSRDCCEQVVCEPVSKLGGLEQQQQQQQEIVDSDFFALPDKYVEVFTKLEVGI